MSSPLDDVTFTVVVTVRHPRPSDFGQAQRLFQSTYLEALKKTPAGRPDAAGFAALTAFNEFLVSRSTFCPDGTRYFADLGEFLARRDAGCPVAARAERVLGKMLCRQFEPEPVDPL